MAPTSEMPPPSEGSVHKMDGFRPADERGYLLSYRLIEEIGRGGQGIVYLAEERRTGRRVALKVLRDSGSISSDALGRLGREVEAAARLHHPGICSVHEAVLDGPTPYIAMRYIEGHTLAQSIGSALQPDERTVVMRRGPANGPPEPDPVAVTERTPSGPSTRKEIVRIVEIIEKAARALHVAHEARVIHRDIKPSNIMVTPEGEPVLLDFGLAEFDESGLAVLTRTGEIWGTPAYLSPEQLLGNKTKLDRRTDIWSLGVTLYECLTLRRPFDGPTNNQIFHSIQAKDPPDPCRLNRSLPSDLRVVLETALEKDRDRRYETALAFAEDLKAVREDRQIEARPIGNLTRFTRWARRNPAVAAPVVAAFSILVIGIVVAATLILKLKARVAEKNTALHERNVESEKKDAALRHSEGLRLLAQSSASLARDPGLALLLAIEGAGLAPDSPVLANGAANEAFAELLEVRTLAGHQLPVETAEFSPDGTRAVTTSTDGDVRVWNVLTGKLLATLAHPRALAATFTPDGTCVVTRTDFTARIWDANTWTELARIGAPDAGDRREGAASREVLPETDPAGNTLRGRIDGILAVSLSPDGGRLLTIVGREAAVWDPASGRRTATLAEPVTDVASINFSPDGGRVLTIAPDGGTVWDTATGQSLAHFPGFQGVHLTRFSPDGRRIVAFTRAHGQVLDCETGRALALKEPMTDVRSVTFSMDGRRLLAITKDSIFIGNAETGDARLLCVPDPAHHDLPQPEAVFTQDGKRVVGASCDGTAHVWLTDTGEELPVMSGQAGDVRKVVLSPDGSLVLTGSSSGTAALWETAHWTQVATLRGHSGDLKHVSFSKDGALVVTASTDRTARVWHSRVTSAAPLLEGHKGPVGHIAFSPGGKLLVTASTDGNPRVWTADGTRQVAQLGGKLKNGQSEPQFSPDGRLILAMCEDGSATVFEAASGKLIASLRGSSGCSLMAFDQGSRHIVTASDDGATTVWDATTGAVVAQLAGHEGAINLAAFYAGGSRVVTAATDRTVRLSDATTGAQVAQMEGHRSQAPAVSPDGRRLVVATDDGVVRICDATSGAVVAKLEGEHHAAPRFSGDGRRLATESSDGVFRIWDAETAAAVSSLSRDEGDQFHGFSPDGRLVLTSSKDGTAHLWDAASGRRIGPIRGRGVPVMDATFSPDGRRMVISTSDETRVFDTSTVRELWVVPRRHGSIRTVRFSADGSFLAAGYAGGLVRLWPSDPLAEARRVAPRDLTLQEIDSHGIDQTAARDDLRDLFDDLLTNEELVSTLENRSGLSDRLRAAAIAAARMRDPHAIAERLCRKSWSQVLAPNADPEVSAIALHRAETALRLFENVERGWTTLGAAQYRAGLYEAALATFEHAFTSAPNSIFISMTHAKLGQRDRAATALAGARRLLEAGGSRYSDEIRRLLAEADSLLAAESRPARH